MSKSEFIRELLALRNEAAILDMQRVTICLDYAHWEVIATEQPPNPMSEFETDPEYP